MKKTWIGKYIDINEKGVEEEYLFRIDAEMDNEGGFRGEVWEEEFYALSKTKISIQGFIKDNHVSFVKTYPFKYEYDENNKVFIDRSQKGHDVAYDGYWEEVSNSWKGEWEIRMRAFDISPDVSRVEFFKGAFEMSEFKEN